MSRRLLFRTGLVLLALFAIGAVVVHHGRHPMTVDRAFTDALPSRGHSVVVRFLAEFGSADSLAIVAFVSVHFGLERRDRRAIAFILCAAILVPGLTELAVKPLVGRRYHQVLTYPSGHVTAATTASVMCLTLLRRWGRRRLLVRSVPLACLVVASVSVAVVWLQWHWFTDALGGIALGAGLTLVLAGLLLTAADPTSREARRQLADRPAGGARPR